MLTKVIVMSSPPQEFDIEDVDPEATLIIESISGLSSADVTLFTGTYATDGGYYQGRRGNPRNVVMTYKMNPDYAADISVSDLRERLYRTFMEPSAVADGVVIQLEDDRKPLRFVRGYVEKLEADHFSATTKAQISLMCVDPYIRSWDSVFESNPGGWATVSFDYEGTADCGIYIQAKVIAVNDKVSFDLNGQKMVLQKPSGNFAVDDVIAVQTGVGQRSVTLNDVDAMALLTADSDWLSVNQPSNTLRTYGDVIGDGLAVSTQFFFQPTWWGI